MKKSRSSHLRLLVVGLFAGGVVVACSALTGSGDYVVKNCLGCLNALCGPELDACNADRGCTEVLTCIERFCPDTPDDPKCTGFCVPSSASATPNTQTLISNARACGFKNCISCASPPSAVPTEDAAASGG